ncbi:MAG: hypothetical protein EOO68_22125, partial [Moraxellaceae bacterium]
MNSESSSPRRRAADNHAPALEWQLLCQAYQNLPITLMVNLSVTIGGSIVLYTDGYSYVYQWIMLTALLSALRLATGVYFKSRYHLSAAVDTTTIIVWKSIFAAGLLSAAMVWVVIALVTITHNQIPPTSRYTLLIIMSAMASGATGITAPLKMTGRIYITLMILAPSLIMIFYSHNDAVIGVLGLIFCAAMIASHASNHKLLRASLTLKLENEQLVNNLQYLNTDLERRVNSRTQALKRIAHHDSLTGLP